MKSCLYVTNIAVPYRERFFEEFAGYCDLTVLYERTKAADRNEEWQSVNGKGYHRIQLKGCPIGAEQGFSFRIFRYLKKGRYDRVVFGCYNSPVQIMAIMAMSLLRRPYFINTDGEIFEPANPVKRFIRNFVLRGAQGYLCAGKQSAPHIREVTHSRNVYPYSFTSLTEEDVKAAQEKVRGGIEQEMILCVGRYEPVKGLDVLLEAALEFPDYSFCFVGMGDRTEAFEEAVRAAGLQNVTAIPFLKKEELMEAYRKACMVVFPSIQECWGLVVNEAAACGTLLVGTYGSGAAVEYLAGPYEQYLAAPGDAGELIICIRRLLEAPLEERAAYRRYLLEKSTKYTIEHMAREHANALFSNESMADWKGVNGQKKWG